MVDLQPPPPPSAQPRWLLAVSFGAKLHLPSGRSSTINRVLDYDDISVCGTYLSISRTDAHDKEFPFGAHGKCAKCVAWTWKQVPLG